MPHTPLLSVVIPTHKRPELLPRAIDSALLSAPDGDVEVVVVPNGPDHSWHQVAEHYQQEPRVAWRPIAVAHANAARNHGLNASRGTFIRFLDDDDCLYPEACRAQLNEMIRNNCDVSSGAIDVTNNKLEVKKRLFQPRTDDMVTGALHPRKRTHTFAHLYQRSYLEGITWDTSRNVGQDAAWFISLAISREARWHRTDEATGAWVQHPGERISRGRDPGNLALRSLSELITLSCVQLETQGRMTPERRQAAADSLWALIQKGLRHDWSYWSDVAKIADRYYPNRRPPSRIHRLPGATLIPPLYIEALIIPFRVAYLPVRRALVKRGFDRA